MSANITLDIPRGERYSAFVGRVAVKVWVRSVRPEDHNHVVVIFDERTSVHPQPVALCVAEGSPSSAELKSKALELMHSSKRHADGITSLVHDFRGNLRGHRMVIVATPDTPPGLIRRIERACVRSAIKNLAT